MSRVPLIVGYAPGRNGGEPLAVGSDTGKRLARIFGATESELHDGCEIINLLTEWPGRAADGKHDLVDTRAAEDAAVALYLDLRLDWRRTVVLGRVGQQAFHKALGMPLKPWFEWWSFGIHGIEVAAMPHPAGTSMSWNDEATRRRGRRFWEELLQ